MNPINIPLGVKANQLSSTFREREKTKVPFLAKPNPLACQGHGQSHQAKDFGCTRLSQIASFFLFQIQS